MVKTSVEKKNRNFKMFIPALITWVFIIAQIICTFFLWDNYYGLDFMVYIGYGVWVLAAIFGIVPIFQFRSPKFGCWLLLLVEIADLLASALTIFFKEDTKLDGIN